MGIGTQQKKIKSLLGKGNLTGFEPSIFTNGSLSGLNLIPMDTLVKNGVPQTEELAARGVASLDSYRGAYDVGDEYWYPGSDWMPFDLEVQQTMAGSEQFAKTFHSVSIVPRIVYSDTIKEATVIAPEYGGEEI